VNFGQIDLLVQDDFHANRTDMIRTAIRNPWVAHADVVRDVVPRKALALGIQLDGVAGLRALKPAG
jgi:hypothetical protein